MALLFRLSLCIVFFGLCMFMYIEKQNRLTKLRIEIPKLAKEIKVLKEEITRLQYDIDQFENPNHLMDLALQPEYGHLKHPLVRDVLTFPEGLAFRPEGEEADYITPVTMASGGN